jgi:uncharacterized membrane protein
MFEFFFKYPASVFAKGTFVLLGQWPVWVLALLAVAAAGFFGWIIYNRRTSVLPIFRGWRSVAIWGLQSALAALLLLLLWQPAISIASLKSQQNVVAVIVDDSQSMAIREGDATRSAQALRVLDSGLLKGLKEKFQVRLYRVGDSLQRVEKVDTLTANEPATRLGDGLKQVMAEAASLPIGAVVLLSDGAENAGGIDLETISEIKRRRIPVHTVGFGREKFDRDIEVTDVVLPARALADSRLSAQVTLRQNGYSGKQARLTVKDGGKVLASRPVQLKGDGQQTEAIVFPAGLAGARVLQVSVDPLEGEENGANNAVTRLVNVEPRKPRILYVEGEPRWEFKFIRRAAEEDRTLEMVSMVRTTQNKIYRQGIANPKELEQGFPATAEDLFQYDAIILGSVEAGYLTPSQQELVRDFVDRRGGGLLALGGRFALGDGSYAKTPVADVLPVVLPQSKSTFQRDQVPVVLTAAGRDSLLCRLLEDPAKNVERWTKMPKLANYQDAGTAKPGAVVLMEALVGTRHLPLLVTQNYGRGRAAVFATGGSWRWQMQQDVSDKTHEIFWQQLLRWLANETPGRMVSSTPKQVLADETRVPLRAEVRDKKYNPVTDARVEARIVGPGGVAAAVELKPDPLNSGVYLGEWTAEKTGSYLVEFGAKRGEEDLGHDVITLRREDGVAENFHAEQNRDLLEKLSSETGGKYWKPADVKKMSEEVSYSEEGITVRETKDLWDAPAFFLLALLLRSSEWLLRRKWGAV